MRAAFSGDLELTRLLLDYGADPAIKSSDNESTLSAASGLGFIHGYHFQHPYEVRLEVVKLLVEEYGLDVNWHDDYGITPLMVAGNLGDVDIIQYLINQGADLGDFDLGKKMTVPSVPVLNRLCPLTTLSVSAPFGPIMLSCSTRKP